MNDGDVSRQIHQMVQFIRQEAEEKANEISVSAEEVRLSVFSAWIAFPTLLPWCLVSSGCSCCSCSICCFYVREDRVPLPPITLREFRPLPWLTSFSAVLEIQVSRDWIFILNLSYQYVFCSFTVYDSRKTYLRKILDRNSVIPACCSSMVPLVPLIIIINVGDPL